MKTVMTKTTCSLGVLLTSLTALLLGCTSQPSGRYQQAHDSAPTRMPTAAELQSATPIQEPLSRQGNQDYQVNGVFYDVMDTEKGYSERGIASWYGNKFHGHLTSNGEYYDMYSMTAAHTRLPLPTYVQVTNLDNQKHVIVRVNDRGPFHSERLIDLSFAAAYKLDMIDNGTAPVKVEAIEFLSQPSNIVIMCSYSPVKMPRKSRHYGNNYPKVGSPMQLLSQKRVYISYF